MDIDLRLVKSFKRCIIVLALAVVVLLFVNLFMIIHIFDLNLCVQLNSAQLTGVYKAIQHDRRTVEVNIPDTIIHMFTGVYDSYEATVEIIY